MYRKKNKNKKDRYTYDDGKKDYDIEINNKMVPDYIEDITTGAAIGAALGSVIPGVGTAVGGAIGGVCGLLKSIFW